MASCFRLLNKKNTATPTINARPANPTPRPIPSAAPVLSEVFFLLSAVEVVVLPFAPTTVAVCTDPSDLVDVMTEVEGDDVPVIVPAELEEAVLAEEVAVPEVELDVADVAMVLESKTFLEGVTNAPSVAIGLSLQALAIVSTTKLQLAMLLSSFFC